MASNSRLSIVISATDNVSPVAKRIGASLQEIGHSASLPTVAIGGLVDALGRIGLAGLGISAVTSAAKGLGSALGIGLNVEMENVRAKLMAFTKDAGQAEEILQMIRLEADKTPFSFQAMAKATAGLMSAAKQANLPLMELVQTAEILAASAPEQGLEGAAFALREAVSGDFTSVIERFNLPRLYINQLKDSGIPALQAVQRAMKQMGFDTDLVSNLAGTASGRWSTLMDTIDGVKSKLSAPLFEILKQSLEETQKALDAHKAGIDGVAIALGGALAGALRTAVQAGKDFGAAVGAVNQFLKDSPGVAAAVVGGLGSVAAALALSAAAAIAHTLATIPLTVATWALAAAQWALNLAMTANPILLITSALVGLAAGLIYAYETSEAFRNVVDSVAATVRDALLPVLDRGMQKIHDFGEAAARLVQFVSDRIGEIASLFNSIPGFNIQVPSVSLPAVPAFAHGGSFTVGGAGGTDSQFVGFMATPGERVSVATPAGGVAAGDPRLLAALSQPIVIQIDGRTIAEVTRSQFIRQNTRMPALGFH